MVMAQVTWNNSAWLNSERKMRRQLLPLEMEQKNCRNVVVACLQVGNKIKPQLTFKTAPEPREMHKPL